MKKIFQKEKNKKACPALCPTEALCGGGKFQQSRGFVILYTVLISSIVLAIIVGISTISYQEVVLSASAKEGNISFFAAETGFECASYWDFKQHVFDPNSPPILLNSIKCNDVLATNIEYPDFKFTLNLSSTSCAVVTVNKDNSVIPVKTVIISKGYNVSCAEVETPTNPRIVERAIRVTY